MNLNPIKKRNHTKTMFNLSEKHKDIATRLIINKESVKSVAAHYKTNPSNIYQMTRSQWFIDYKAQLELQEDQASVFAIERSALESALLKTKQQLRGALEEKIYYLEQSVDLENDLSVVLKGLKSLDFDIEDLFTKETDPQSSDRLLELYKTLDIQDQ